MIQSFWYGHVKVGDWRGQDFQLTMNHTMPHEGQKEQDVNMPQGTKSQTLMPAAKIPEAKYSKLLHISPVFTLCNSSLQQNEAEPVPSTFPLELPAAVKERRKSLKPDLVQGLENTTREER